MRTGAAGAGLHRARGAAHACVARRSSSRCSRAAAWPCVGTLHCGGSPWSNRRTLGVQGIMTLILGRKRGMTQLFAEDGTVTGVTVVEAGPCVVTQVRNQELDGYDAV